VKRRHVLAAGAVVVTAVAILIVVVFLPAGSAGPCEVVDTAALPEIRESSGLAVSRRTPGILWSHNDSGNEAVLFALDTQGVVRGRVRVPVRTRDWEDVSIGPCPSGDCLYIADIGDNRRVRRQIQIYRVPEPAIGDAQTAPVEKLNAVYADGPHNAEAVFVAGRDLFIVTRDGVGGVYRSMASAGQDLTFQRVGALGFGPVTDAETSRDGTSVVVRSSHEVVLYRTSELIAGRMAPYLRVPIDGLKEWQGEGVALDGSLMYLSSEGMPWSRGGSLVTLRCRWPR
jgi:hypothetical protein